MTNSITNYDSMDNTEKATFLYDFALEHDSDILEGVLLDLSSYLDEPVFYLSDWLDNFDNNVELVKIAQQNDHFDLDDTYIREGIFYSDSNTSDSVIDLIDKDASIYWIAIALEYMPQDVYELTNLIID